MVSGYFCGAAFCFVLIDAPKKTCLLVHFLLFCVEGFFLRAAAAEEFEELTLKPACPPSCPLDGPDGNAGLAALLFTFYG